VIVAFIRDHQGHRELGGLRWGVESICRVLSEHGVLIAPSTYYEHVGKTPTAPQRPDANWPPKSPESIPKTSGSTAPARCGCN
jgi:hypothetical protein